MKRRIFCGCGTVKPGNGGIGRVARLTLTALAEGGYHVSAAALLDEGVDIVAGIPVVGCNGNKIAFAAQNWAAALRHSAFYYDAAGIARAQPPLPWLRKAVFIHGIEVWGKVRPDYAKALNTSQRLISNSRYTLDRAKLSLGSLPETQVCWLATEQDEAEDRQAPERPTVLILGRVSRLENYKGHNELVDAWPAVVAAVPAARLVIAGSGDGLDDLRARVAASPVSAAIDVKGFVPEADLDDLWRNTTVFAMPSRGEGFGLVYIEAMRFGIPVIASTHDAGQEVNVDEVTGFNVSMDEPGRLTERLIELLASPDLCARMGAAGQARWREHFRYSAFRDRFLAIMDPFTR